MMLKSMVGLAILFSFQLASAQDFRKSYKMTAPSPGIPAWGAVPPAGVRGPGPPVPGGGHIKVVVDHVIGNLKVTGYDGKTVDVTVKKKGPDSDLIQVKDNSYGNWIDLYISYPPFHMGPSSVECEVRVPNAVEYNFVLIAPGKVEISGIAGRLWAKSDRGTVDLKDVRGWVSASSTSGNLNIEISRPQDRSSMRFSTISGNIKVSAPANFDALVDISSNSGFLKSDFPIEIQEARYGPGRFGRAKLGSGKQVLYISSELGQVSLVQD